MIQIAGAPYSSAIECSRKVEGQARAMRRRGLGEVQGAVADSKIGSGRDDIEMITFGQHAICRLLNDHRGMFGQQIHHHAFVGRIEMLDNEGHADVGGQRIYQLRAGVETVSRRADRNDREALGIAGAALPTGGLPPDRVREALRLRADAEG
jgi:hypothetical protein